MTQHLLFVGMWVMGRTWICPYVPSWRHGHTKIMPWLQEYGSPVPLELSSSPELQDYCFPGMAVPKHFLPMSWITCIRKNPNKEKPLQDKKPYTPQTKPKQNQSKAKKTKANQSKPNNSHQDQIKNLKHFYFSVGSITGNSNNLPFPLHQYVVKEKQQRRAAAGEN